MGFYGLQHAHRFRTNLKIQNPKKFPSFLFQPKLLVFLKIHQKPILMIDLWITQFSKFSNMHRSNYRFKVTTTHPSSTLADQSALGEGKAAPGILPTAASSSLLSSLRRPNHCMCRSHKCGPGTFSHRYHRLAGSATPAVARTRDPPECLQADTSATASK